MSIYYKWRWVQGFECWSKGIYQSLHLSDRLRDQESQCVVNNCDRSEMKPESCLVGGFQSEKTYKPGPAVWVTCDSWSFKYKGRRLERKMIYVQTWRVERSCSGRIKLEGASASLQGGFPEVTVLNITQECGMLNHCQNKHTGRATATPSDCQGLLYTHMLSCMCRRQNQWNRLSKSTLFMSPPVDQTIRWSNRTEQKVLAYV